MMHADTLINTATIQQFLMKDYCPALLLEEDIELYHTSLVVLFICVKRWHLEHRLQQRATNVQQHIKLQCFSTLWWSLCGITVEECLHHSPTRSISYHGQPSWVQHTNILMLCWKNNLSSLSASSFLCPSFTAESCMWGLIIDTHAGTAIMSYI